MNHGPPPVTSRGSYSPGPDVAAHALDGSRAVLSLDAEARFAELPGVRAIAP